MTPPAPRPAAEPESYDEVIDALVNQLESVGRRCTEAASKLREERDLWRTDERCAGLRSELADVVEVSRKFRQRRDQETESAG